MVRPLYQSLLAYSDEIGLRLHMPGHSGGLGINSPQLHAVAELDITEVPGIDDLHSPQDTLLESQLHAAKLYGAELSCYLVNGASSGIQALFMALCREGEQVIIPRNAHRSFHAALILSGAEPVYLPVQCEALTGEAVTVRPADLEATLKATADSCKAVFLTSPSFLGTTLDLLSAVSMTNECRLPLCVDEAHGGHFAFHSAYPATALQCGAAAAVNGLHKNLAVLNQGAILHLNATFPEPARLVKAVSLLTTTSPSYPILASIELALEQMEINGEVLLTQALKARSRLGEQMKTLAGMSLMEEEFLSVPGVLAVDPLKVTINCSGTGLNGYELDVALRREKGIQVEMAGPNYVMAMFSPWHSSRAWDDFYCALADIAHRYPGPRAQITSIELAPATVKCLNPRQAFNSPWEKIAIEDATGRIAAEMVAAYPPGTPCIVPGELITDEMLDYLIYLRKRAIRIQGPLDPGLKSLLVING